MTPTARTLNHVRKLGLGLAEVVERWNPHSRTRKDYLGFIDILLVSDTEITGIQATSGSNHSARIAKSMGHHNIKPWLSGPGRSFLVVSWSKNSKGRWKPRATKLVLSDNGIETVPVEF